MTYGTQKFEEFRDTTVHCSTTELSSDNNSVFNVFNLMLFNVYLFFWRRGIVLRWLLLGWSNCLMMHMMYQYNLSSCIYHLLYKLLLHWKRSCQRLCCRVLLLLHNSWSFNSFQDFYFYQIYPYNTKLSNNKTSIQRTSQFWSLMFYMLHVRLILQPRIELGSTAHKTVTLTNCVIGVLCPLRTIIMRVISLTRLRNFLGYY